MRCAETHTPLPENHLERTERFVELLNTHKQTVCPDCGRWAIWIPKEKKE